MQVLFVGGGFAGMAAARVVAKQTRRLPGWSLTLVDPNPYSTMLPILPDVAAGRLMPEDAMAKLIPQLPSGVRFLRSAVERVDLERRCVVFGNGTQRHYDGLVLASGSRARLPTDPALASAVMPLNSLSQAVAIRDAVSSGRYRQAVVVGAGYTGVELACALAEQKALRRVTLLERGPLLLPFLPTAQRRRVCDCLERLGVDVRVQASVQTVSNDCVTLASGDRLSSTLVLWTAGVEAAMQDIRGRVEQLPDGRLITDAFLGLPGYPGAFAAGDMVALIQAGRSLRRAVNFSIYGGRRAGANLFRVLQGGAPKRFRPVDLGWVIPLCIGSVGRIMGGVPIHGRLGLRLHYGMTGYRHFTAALRRRLITKAFRLRV